MNRRSLLKGLAATGVVVQLMPHVGIKAFAHALPRRGLLRTAAGNKNAMVILRLYGGNDGLNTLVPVHDENYYRFRHRGTNRNVSILPEETLLLPDHATLGLHPSFALLHEMYQEGKMTAVQNVGYPNQDLSHIRSTDIWLTGSDDLLWVGGSYRYEDGYAAMAGINVSNTFNVGYAYDFTTTALNTVSRGTHEIMVGFIIGNKYSEQCPRCW